LLKEKSVVISGLIIKTDFAQKTQTVTRKDFPSYFCMNYLKPQIDDEIIETSLSLDFGKKRREN